MRDVQLEYNLTERRVQDRNTDTQLRTPATAAIKYLEIGKRMSEAVNVY